MYVSESIFCIVRKNWPYPPTASGSCGREGGKPADKIRVNFEILKFLYSSNYLEFYFVYYQCYFTAVLELHSVSFCQVKVYFKVCFKVRKVW